jgi:hypothetical protein
MTAGDLISRLKDCDPTYYMARKGYTPFIHQQLLLWKWRFKKDIRVLIGDEIGLGKTIEAAMLLRALVKDRNARKSSSSCRRFSGISGTRNSRTSSRTTTSG